MEPLLNEILRQPIRFDYGESGIWDAGIAHLPAGNSTGWRKLPSFMFSQAHSGGERISLSDGRQAEASRGAIILLPPGVRHKVDVTTRRESRYWAHINYFVMDDLDLFSVVQPPLCLEATLGRRMGDVIGQWVSERTELEKAPLAMAARKQELAARLLYLLAPVCRPIKNGVHHFEAVQDLLPVLHHMRTHLAQPIRRDDLAQIACLSAPQFHVVFHRVMGASPMQYLRTIRLRRAQQMLISTNTPIKQIANDCGYPDPFVFCKFFKRMNGYSPSEYRLRIRP